MDVQEEEEEEEQDIGSTLWSISTVHSVFLIEFQENIMIQSFN